MGLIFGEWKFFNIKVKKNKKTHTHTHKPMPKINKHPMVLYFSPFYILPFLEYSIQIDGLSNKKRKSTHIGSSQMLLWKKL